MVDGRKDTVKAHLNGLQQAGRGISNRCAFSTGRNDRPGVLKMPCAFILRPSKSQTEGGGLAWCPLGFVPFPNKNFQSSKAGTWSCRWSNPNRRPAGAGNIACVTAPSLFTCKGKNTATPPSTLESLEHAAAVISHYLLLLCGVRNHRQACYCMYNIHTPYSVVYVSRLPLSPSFGPCASWKHGA